MYKTKKKIKEKTKFKYASRYKRKTQSKKLTKKISPINKQKTLRIIFHQSPGLVNDATIYKNEFLKQGYKVDFKLIETVHNKNKESYYDINLILICFFCKRSLKNLVKVFHGI